MSKTAAVIVLLLVTAACGSVVSRGTASSSRLASPVPVSGMPPGSGSIMGSVGYPAGVLPAQTIYAITTGGSRFYTLETAFGQRTYTMLGVAPGDYFVFSITTNFLPGQASSSARSQSGYRFPAGYTKAVPCGLSIACSDHTPISVHVAGGATTSGVDPVDWYGPNDSFPLIPPSGAAPVRSGVPDYSTVVAPLPLFKDLNKAMQYVAVAATTARYVQSSSACPVNVACVRMTGEHDGQAAAYFTVEAGSNSTTQNCDVYLVSTSSGWQGLGGYVWSSIVCSLTGAPFPSVGESGQIQMALGETGCVNVHSAPSLSAKVVGCLPKGTAVAIDDGPAYAPASPPLPQIDLPWALDYWWHIVGRGWVVHAYVLTRRYG
jgi:hypothetical protein